MSGFWMNSNLMRFWISERAEESERNFDLNRSRTGNRLASGACMIDIAEMKERILASLEEAGAETVNSLLNTVITPEGVAAEPELFERALVELVDEKLVYLDLTNTRWPRDWRPNDDARMAIENLATHYVYDIASRYWQDSRYVWTPGARVSEPEVVLTDAGKEASISLLQARGYEWWTAASRARADELQVSSEEAFVIVFHDRETREISSVNVFGAPLYAKIRTYFASRGIPETATEKSCSYTIDRETRAQFEAAFLPKGRRR